MTTSRILPLLCLCLMATTLAGCATLPTDYVRSESHALANTNDTALGRMFAAPVAAHGGKLSGVYPLSSGLDALAARIGLANVAERSLDAQYYIWEDDLTGKVLLDALLRAADRGVRVRLLLDDLPQAGIEEILRTISVHPNIEVRLFNPFAQRRIRAPEMLARFGRLNRRMHNKTYIADNQAAIVGGRNIGNEYFEAKPELDYRDFDVLTVGPVVSEVSESFDLYWNSELVVPITAFRSPDYPTDKDLQRLRTEFAAHARDAAHSTYAEAVRSGDFVQQSRRGEFPLLWGTAHAVYDEPGKATTPARQSAGHLTTRLEAYVTGLRRELFVLSPYFVPEKSGVDLFARLEKRGVAVRIVTNSLASTDVTTVFAGYSRYRIPLLRSGVELWELKPSARREERHISPLGSIASSRGSLHAKVLVFDRESAFVGSMNLDPRSLRLNTEIGIIVESHAFAEAIVETVGKKLPMHAYRLELDPTDSEEESGTGIVWLTEDKQGHEQRYTHDPESSWWRRFKVGIMSIFIPEGQI